MWQGTGLSIYSHRLFGSELEKAPFGEKPNGMQGKEKKKKKVGTIPAPLTYSPKSHQKKKKKKKGDLCFISHERKGFECLIEQNSEVSIN